MGFKDLFKVFYCLIFPVFILTYFNLFFSILYINLVECFLNTWSKLHEEYKSGTHINKLRRLITSYNCQAAGTFKEIVPGLPHWFSLGFGML